MRVMEPLATVLILACSPPLAGAQTAQPAPAQPPLPHPCLTMTEAKQFDFWIGTWDVTPWQVAAPTPKQTMGVNEIYPILEHCVLSDNWAGARGGKGKSYNFYDTNVKKWRQIWMADSGGPLDYTGEFRDGAHAIHRLEPRRAGQSARAEADFLRDCAGHRAPAVRAVVGRRQDLEANLRRTLRPPPTGMMPTLRAAVVACALLCIPLRPLRFKPFPPPKLGC